MITENDTHHTLGIVMPSIITATELSKLALLSKVLVEEKSVVSLTGVCIIGAIVVALLWLGESTSVCINTDVELTIVNVTVTLRLLVATIAKMKITLN